MMKRLYLGLLAVAAIAVLTTVGSLALFADYSSPVSYTYSTGTVRLGTPTTRLASISGLAPGDSGSSGYTITYSDSKNIDAWLGIDITTTGTLFSCNGGGKFNVTVTDGEGNTYTADSGSTLVVKGPSGAIAPVSTGVTKDFTIAYSLASSANNTCQDKSAQVTITFHAVQSANNTKTDGSGPKSWTETPAP